MRQVEETVVFLESVKPAELKSEVGVTCSEGGNGSLDSCCTSSDGVPMGEESEDVWSCENAIPLGPCGSTSLLMSS